MKEYLLNTGLTADATSSQEGGKKLVDAGYALKIRED
jgi:hypothetical protein